MTNFERIKNMTSDELAMFLMKVNCAYAEDCMIFDCKYPNINNNCAICFKEWLENEYDIRPKTPSPLKVIEFEEGIPHFKKIITIALSVIASVIILGLFFSFIR